MTEDESFALPDWLLQDIEVPPGYIEINAFSNAADFLHKAESFLLQTDDPFRWKWSSIALTSALYGFMICALEGGNYIRVMNLTRLDPKKKKRLRELEAPNTAEEYRERKDIIDEHVRKGGYWLISFGEALKRVRQLQPIKSPIFSGTVTLSNEEHKNILELRKALRDEFEHFRPMLWLIPEARFYPLFRDTCTVLSQVLSCGNVVMARWCIDDPGVSLESLKQRVERIRSLVSQGD